MRDITIKMNIEDAELIKTWLMYQDLIDTERIINENLIKIDVDLTYDALTNLLIEIMDNLEKIGR